VNRTGEDMRLSGLGAESTCAIAMTPLSRHAGRDTPSLEGLTRPLVALPGRRRAHSVPLRADNHGQQRCQQAHTPTTLQGI
jgi:hypothetical protein